MASPSNAPLLESRLFDDSESEDAYDSDEKVAISISDEEMASSGAAQHNDGSLPPFSWRKLWQFTGPGFLMSIAFLDPGNLEGDLQAGAAAGYSLLWLLLWSTAMGLLVQLLSARLGVATGRHLAELCREEYPRCASVALWLMAELALIGADIQEVIGSAIAIKILSGGVIPLWGGVIVTALDCFIFLFLENYGVRKLEAFFAVLIATMAVSFAVMFGQTKPSGKELLIGVVVPKLSSSTIKQAVGIVGCIIMPHNVFLHSALVQSRKIDNGRKSHLREAMRYYSIEATIALLVSLFINVCVTTVFAKGFYGTEVANIIGLENAGQFLQEKYGGTLFPILYIWAIGLLASGQSSTITGTYAGQFIMGGFLSLRLKKWVRSVITRSFAILPAMLVALMFDTEGSAMDTLNELLNVLQSIQIPFALIPLLTLVSQEKVMGVFKIGPIMQVVTWIVVSFLIVINGYLLLDFFSAEVHGQLFTCLLCLIAAVYVMFIAYLVVRVTCVFCLYAWCAATDPGDPGVFKSKKYLKVDDYRDQILSKGLKQEGSTKELNVETTAAKQHDESIYSDATKKQLGSQLESERLPGYISSWLAVLLSCCGLSCLFNWCRHEQSSEDQVSEEGMFYCSLCEVEVLKYSKHCRVCDKCVDGFDHHCRWINNCIGRKNYKRFFILMVFALLLLILQWAVGMLVLILCFLDRKHFSAEIVSKLGSSFSLVPFVVVVATCTILAMVATLPVAQLFFFHILLIKKGISTYDYIIALREQEQELEQEQQAVGGQQSPQMSQVSSFTGLSSTSSFNAFHRGSWCTPPRLFLEDQFDVVPPEIGTSAIHASKKMMVDEPVKRRNAGTIKISPWTLARLNAEEVSKAAAQARKRSKILQPIIRRETLQGQDTESSIGSGSGRMASRPDNRRRTNKRGRFPPADLPLEPLAKISASATDSNASDLAPETSTGLAPLQLEARSAFRPNRPMPSARAVASSPESSLGSPDLHPFRISSSGAEEAQDPNSFSSQGIAPPKGIQLSRSTSDGYEASGGEDSDRIPSRIVHRSSNWASIVLSSEHVQITDDLKASSSASLQSYARQQ